MKTKEQVTKEFMADLKSLINKYGATIEASDHWEGHSSCGSDIRMTVVIPSKWKINDQLSEFTEIDLGSYIK